MVALEISTERRPSNHPPGNASVDPTFESRECPRWEPLGFDSRGRRFTSPLHPRGRLISYSTERPQNKRKATHRTSLEPQEKGTASSGGRLASETPCDARLAGLRTVSVLLPP